MRDAASARLETHPTETMQLTCPECGLEQAVWLPDCPRCGASGITWGAPEGAAGEAAAETLIEATVELPAEPEPGVANEQVPERKPRRTIPLYSPTFHVSERGTLSRPSWVVATLVLITTAALAVAMGGGQRDEARAAAPAQPPSDAVVVTFRAGDKCVVSNWAFRYLRTYRRHGRKNGAVVADRVDRHESVEDELLRYYGGLGEHRALRPSELRSIQLLVGPRHDGIDGFAVSETRVLTERFTDELRPFAVAGSSHPLMLVPDARHYWPNDYEDDPARVRGVSVHLVGDFSEGCPSQGYIDLTSDRHALARTPIRIEFPSQ